MDINTATTEELQQIAQIDGTRARYLVEDRSRRGRFDSWDEIKQVRSYEDGMVERLQNAGFTIADGSSGAQSSTRGNDRPRTSRGGESKTRLDGESSTRLDRESSTRRSAGTRSLNRASAEELEQGHMIDGERARRLVEYRTQHGGFRDWNEVRDVTGIDDGTVHRLQEAGFELR